MTISRASCTLAELQQFARGRLGLIIGPSVTTSAPEFYSELSRAIAEKFCVDLAGAYHETAEAAVNAGTAYDDVKQFIIDHAAAQSPSPMLTHLARVRFSAVLSATFDGFFEQALEDELRRRPVFRDLSVISNLADIARPKTLRVYKLLGSSTRRDLVVTTADLLRRTPLWRPPTREFLDELKASPVLCVGFAGATWILDILFGHLFSHRGLHPGRVIFLADDAVSNNSRLLQMVPPTTLVLAQGALRDVAKAVEPTDRNRQLRIELAPTKSGEATSLDLSEFADLFAFVNTYAEPRIAKDERERLLDYLFMPDVINWDPIGHGLDFPRTISNDAITTVSQLAVADARQTVLVLHGRAASGKTIILKRLALDCVKAGLLVLWLKDYWYSDAAAQLGAAFRKIRSVIKDKPIVMVADDPKRLAELSSGDILRAASKEDIRVVLVLGTRTSDHQQSSREVPSDAVQEVLELSDVLDDTEWAALPQYLLKLGLAKDGQDAQDQAQRAADTKQTRDTLALLHWLLPQTRQSISRSVQEEYVRLGNSSGVTRILSGAIQRSTRILQDAYGMVAVSAHYGVSLPIEVLVSALGISYSDWLPFSPVGQRGACSIRATKTRKRQLTGRGTTL